MPAASLIGRLVGVFTVWKIPLRPHEAEGNYWCQKARTRVLNDDELRALWKASEAMRLPLRGPVPNARAYGSAQE